jgi:DNA polymerase-3 subunit alpha (Gram-positive type)
MVTSYVCVDVETTGLNPKSENIIEIGAVKVVDGQVVDTFQSFLKPRKPLEDRIVALTGITDEMLVDAPDGKKVMPLFAEFCGDLPLVGHNLIFDYAFLKRAMLNEKLSFERKGVDTLKIARKYLPELESRNLGFLCQHF